MTQEPEDSLEIRFEFEGKAYKVPLDVYERGGWIRINQPGGKTRIIAPYLWDEEAMPPKIIRFEEITLKEFMLPSRYEAEQWEAQEV